TSFGIMSAFVKDVTRSGFDYEKVADEWSEKSAMDIVALGLDRGAVLSYLPGVLGTLDNQLNGALGESIGMTPRTKGYRPRLGLDETVPGFGYAGNVVDAATQAVRGALPNEINGVKIGKEYTAKDLNKVRRVLPIQNTFYLAWLFNFAEEAIVERADLPEKAGQKQARIKL
ncbi:unnamed protein product, partial [marine sediment metagenome]